MNVLLDSVILIDLLNGSKPAANYVRELGPSAFVSPITRAEVLSGLDPESAAAPRAFLNRFQSVDIDSTTADLAASLRRTHRWKLPDAFQAALAQQHGLVLATRNTRDFDPKRHAFVTVPYAAP